MKLTFELPKIGRGRLITTVAMASSGSALWIWSASQLVTPEAMPMLATVGVGCPFGVGFVTALLMEQRIVRDLRPAGRRNPEPERPTVSEQLDAGDAVLDRERRAYGRVIEGEVVR